MLLGYELLAVARTWLYREKIEWEAAAAFRSLGDQLEALNAPGVLLEMVRKAERDEVEHAGFCRDIAARLAPELSPLEPRPATSPAPGGLSPEQEALYTSLALSCVTETLSAALLIEMQKRTEDQGIRDVVHRILKDEIEHGRVGWAHLALEAEKTDVTWLAPYLGDMIRAALGSENESLKNLSADAESMGILTPERSRRITETTFREVVLPGVERYGIDTAAARETLERVLNGSD